MMSFKSLECHFARVSGVTPTTGLCCSTMKKKKNFSNCFIFLALVMKVFFWKKIWERVAGEEKASQPSKQVCITTATKYESLIFLKKLTYYGSSIERLMIDLPGLEAKPFRLQRLRAEFESHTYSEIWLHFIFIGWFNTSLTLLWLNK